ncbi:DUF7263 family protein [Halomicrobium salinisoli]|uniref:DUF7263 family protein n=1 Tax=Halomicrobium salinisoli TaxID=2878391 RepID=UPI001CF0B94C|nr:hypothetical protein [Halomicrobium salinisoli]
MSRESASVASNLGRANGSDRRERHVSRAQTSLPSIALALLVLTTTTGLCLALADGAIGAADRDAGERRAATSLAAALVDADSPLTDRANVLNGTRLAAFDEAELSGDYPVADEWDVTVRVGERTAASTGGATGGTTARRLVSVTDREVRTVDPTMGWGRRVTLPRRSAAATVELRPGDATVETVRANDRVVLHDPDGLNGTYDVALSRFETTTFRLEAEGELGPDAVAIEYEAMRTRKTTLTVTVDD